MEVKFNAGDSARIPKGCKATIKDGVVIFEKEESKEQEFKRGDVIVSTMNEILIVDVHSFEKHILRSFVNIKEDGTLFNSSYSSWNERHTWRLASEEEKQKLFDKMKEQGLRWNAGEKCVEKIRWRAGHKCRYFYIDSCIRIGSSADFRYTEDEERWEVGNYFQTKEEAEEVVKILRESLCKFHAEKTE
ncbi:hypothetical protein [Prevotella intermedia]|uniref:Uncharacterized protein n=1 Tax=Prevotella intermedia TaxID=28131 RepID=A0A2G8I8E9_PREIN|nr:hypothetical protein [Prevotella intermedia]PIK19783.1 hypothetical protein CTI18_13030 [Prevotella intermedia]